MTDPVLKYNASKDGWRLKTLYEKFEGHPTSSMLIIMKSDKDTVFGAYLDTIFELKGGNKYAGSNESFVF